MLVIMSNNNPIGNFLHNYFDIDLLFSFDGLVVASCFYSLPFMMQPIQNAFEKVDNNLIEAAYVLQKSKLETISKNYYSLL